MMKSTKSSWDPGRFLQTLAYFEVIPVLNWVQRLLQGSSLVQPAMHQPVAPANTVLVVHATSRIGRHVVRQLRDRGYAVRALVPTPEQGNVNLGHDVDTIAADITQPEALTAASIDRVRAVIYSLESPVSAADNTPIDLKQHLQGIQNLLQAVAQPLQAIQSGELPVFDFTTGSATAIANLWGALDDVVMGGVSASTIRQSDGAALFTGTVSTANSGGFASVRSRNLEPALNLSHAEGIKLRVKGDGQRYKFLLRSNDNWDSIAYSYSFDTQADNWINVFIPFSGLVPVFRAKTLPTAEQLNTSRICSLQLMLSKFEYDGQLNPHFTPGPFALQLQAISAYGNLPRSQFILVNAMAEGDRPAGDAAETAVRHSGIPYTIIRPGELTDDPGGKQLTVAQHPLHGSISGADVATICIHAIEQPAARNVTFAVKAEASEGTADWEGLFSNLTPDA